MSSSDHYNTIINTNNDKNDEDDCMVIKKKEQGGETNNNDYDINNNDYVEGWEEKDQKMVLVVSVEKDNKASRHALKFAIDRFLMSRNKKIRRNISLILLHVRLHNLTFPLSCYHHDLSSRESSPSSFVEREPDDYELEILSPFRYFCARRQIKFEIVVVEDFDVAQALVDYTVRHRVENLFLGSNSSSSSSANGFSRLFKNNCCAAKMVVKWVPDFCNVYIVSTQGKLSGVRNARCPPLPTIPKHHNHNQTHPHHHIELSDDEMESVAESDVSSSESSSSAVTTMFNSFSDFTLIKNSLLLHPHHQFTPCKPQRRRSTSLCLTHKLKSMEDEIKRLKFEQNNSNQTADVIN